MSYGDLTAKEFGRELSQISDQLRKSIDAESLDLDTSDEAIAARRKRVLNGDFSFFAYTYFPHHIWGEQSEFQKHVMSLFPVRVFSVQGSRDFWVAPRGEGKSTILTKIGPCYLAVVALLQQEAIRKEVSWQGPPPPLKDYALLLGAETKLPTKLLTVVKTELEFNPALEIDFPDVVGRSNCWKMGEIVTRTNVKIEPFGAEQAVRGTFHGASRPGILFGDDLITDKEAKSPVERNNRWTWLEKAIDYLGPPDGSVNFMGVGTILNKDDPISRAKKAVGYLVHHFKAIIKPPKHMDLWDKCEEVMVNEDKRAEEKAAEKGEELPDTKLPSYQFYLKRKKKMDKGAVVSWPSVRSLYNLMRQRAKNRKAFNTEMQGDARSDEDKVFTNLRYWVHLSGRFIHYAGCDPSMGKGQTSDPSAIVGGAWDTRKLLLNIILADGKRRIPSTLNADLIRYQREHNFTIIGFENNNAYEHMRGSFINEGIRQGVALPMRGITATVDPAVRIESLEPPINDPINPKILFHPNLISLTDQLDDWPEKTGDHHYDLLCALHIVYMIAVSSAGGIPNILTSPRGQPNRFRGYQQ